MVSRECTHTVRGLYIQCWVRFLMALAQWWGYLFFPQFFVHIATCVPEGHCVGYEGDLLPCSLFAPRHLEARNSPKIKLVKGISGSNTSMLV